MHRFATRFWNKYGIIGTCFAVSVGVHMLGLVVFGSYKLFQYIYPQDMAFEAAPFSKKAVQLRVIQHKVSLKKPPQQNQRVIRRLSVNRLAKINLPTMPNRDAMARKFEVSKNFLDGGNIFGGLDVAENVFGSVKKMDNAFVGKIYALDEGTSLLPKRWPGKPIGTIYTRQINVPTQPFTAGFPGVSDRFEWFGIEYTAEFYVRTAGEYVWTLARDDGASLYMDGNMIIYDPITHPTTTTSVNRKLREGKHTIRIRYFQGPRTELALQLWVQQPGAGERVIFNLNDYPIPADMK